MAKKEYTNEEILNLLKTDQDTAIEYLFRQYYSYLCLIANRVLKNQQTSEDIVQEVFFDLWKKRGNFKIKNSVQYYLRKATVNKTLNYIRDNKFIFDDDAQFEYLPDSDSTVLKLEKEELEKRINEGIDNLPEKARIVFLLSRHEQLSYKEIAAKLGISIKTVENHISKALKLLRTHLKPYTDKILLITINFMLINYLF